MTQEDFLPRLTKWHGWMKHALQTPASATSHETTEIGAGNVSAFTGASKLDLGSAPGNPIALVGPHLWGVIDESSLHIVVYEPRALPCIQFTSTSNCGKFGQTLFLLANWMKCLDSLNLEKWGRTHLGCWKGNCLVWEWAQDLPWMYLCLQWFVHPWFDSHTYQVCFLNLFWEKSSYEE